MKTNESKADRMMRLIVAVLITGIGIYFKSWWGLVALIPFFTAFTGALPVIQNVWIQHMPTRKK